MIRWLKGENSSIITKDEAQHFAEIYVELNDEQLELLNNYIINFIQSNINGSTSEIQSLSDMVIEVANRWLKSGSYDKSKGVFDRWLHGVITNVIQFQSRKQNM